MITRVIKSTVAATVVLGALMAPTALAATGSTSGNSSQKTTTQTTTSQSKTSQTKTSQTTQKANNGTSYKIAKHNIVLNGKVVSNPYGIAAPDPNTGKATTYMPLWYVMQALKAAGTTYSWNGSFLNITPATNMSVDLSNLNPGREATELAINNTVVQTSPKIVMKDPYSHVMTTYIPIYYVMDVLKRLGVTSQWNGQDWTMTLVEVGSVSLSAANNTIGQGQPDTLTVAIKDQNGNTMNVPASDLTWTINNPAGVVNPNTMQFIATAPGAYQIQASYLGVKSSPITVDVSGPTAAINLSTSGSLVADGKSTLTVNVAAVDANNTPETTENGTVTISDSRGWLITGTSNGQNTTGKSVTVSLHNGVGTVQVVAPTTAGLSDTLTASNLSDPQGTSPITYGSLTVNSVAQQATALQITPVNGQKYLVSNQGGNTAQFTVAVVDQAGVPMQAGNWTYDIQVSGPATYNGPTSEPYVGGTTPIPITLESQQGATGTVTVTVSASGLQPSTATVQDVITQAPTHLSAVSASGQNSFAEGSTLAYTLSGLDPNGYPTNFPTTPLVAFVQNADGQPATNIKVNGQPMGASGVPINSPNLAISDDTGGADAGNYVLLIKDSTGSIWLNQPFTETAGSASQILLTPSTNEVTEANPSTTLTVEFADTYDNPVSVPSSSVTVTAQGGSGSATINGQDATKGVSVTTDANGQAQFQFDPHSPAGTTWTVTASANGLSSSPATVSVMNSLVAQATVSITDQNTGSTSVATAGDPLDVTFGAIDTYGNTGYQGTDQFRVSFPANSLMDVNGAQTSNGISSVSGTLTQLQSDFAGARVGAGPALTVTIQDLNVTSAKTGVAQMQVIPGQFAGFALFNNANQLISSSNPLPVEANTPVEVFIRPVDKYGNPVNAVTQSDTVDLLDNGAGGFFRATPTGANEEQITFPVGAVSEPVYYVNAQTESVDLSAAVSNLAPTESSVSLASYTPYASGTNGTGTLTVHLLDQSKYPVSNQAGQLVASATSGSPVTIGAFTETSPGVYSATVTSTGTASGVVITVKDGAETIGATSAFTS